MFTAEMKEHIGSMREKFFRTGSTEGITGVRPEILDGWKKARSLGGRIEDRFERVIGENELRGRILRQKELYDTAVRYMEELYEFLKGEGIYTSFVDADGYILKNLADDELIGTANVRSREGSYRGPDIPMFSLYQHTLETKQLFTIYATEHSNAVNDDWAGTAAPVLSKDEGMLLGVIGISCRWDRLDRHVSALVVMMAEAIADQLELKKHQQALLYMYESADFGIAQVGKEGNVRYINTCGKKLFGIQKSDASQASSEILLPYLKQAISAGKIKKEPEGGGSFEREVTPGKSSRPVICSFMRIQIGSVLTEEYFVTIRDKAEMKKTAMKLIGSNAPFSLQDIIGESEPMKQAKAVVEVASNYMPHTLLLGESGTGKELFAQAIHNNSPRAGGPFVAVNCGAIPKSLIESELFGYEAGAFTGAQKQGYMGKFEQANGGTIFLDEIGDMPYETQVVLLRVLQSKEIIRVGGKKPIKIDVAVIAATNQDLMKKIEEKTFRADLYYRLNTFVIQIPALRARGPEDVILLAEYFLSRNSIAKEKGIAGLTEEARAVLIRYAWPGNVRELENVVERAVLVCDGAEIGPRHIMLEAMLREGMPSAVQGSGPETSQRSRSETVQTPAGAGEGFPWAYGNAAEAGAFANGLKPPQPRRHRMPAAQEEKRIREAMELCDYNLTMASEMLGISRPTLYKKLEKYGISRFGGKTETD